MNDIRHLADLRSSALATGWERDRERIIHEMVRYHEQYLFVIGPRVMGFNSAAAADGWIPTPAGTSPLDGVWLR